MRALHLTYPPASDMLGLNLAKHLVSGWNPGFSPGSATIRHAHLLQEVDDDYIWTGR
jgi:hypothetical protein